MSDQLIKYVANMQEQEALALTKELLEAGVPPMEVLDDCRAAMDLVGKRFENQEYFMKSSAWKPHPLGWGGKGARRRWERTFAA